MTVELIGVPTNSAGTPDGVGRAPVALRAAGLGPAPVVVDAGDVGFRPASPERDPVTGLIAPESLVSMVGAVRDATRRVLEKGNVPLVVGGDCPVLLGALAAARDRLGPVALLFVDGHEDAWPPHASPTGEAADTELGLALGLVATPLPPGLSELLPLVEREDVILLGPRDAAEVAEAGVPSLAGRVALVDSETLGADDVAGVARASAESLARRRGRWWLHLDLDVLSTEALPAVDYPQPGGLSWSQLEALTGAALLVPGVVGADLTIYNPDLDPDRSGAGRVAAYVASSLVPGLATRAG